jgi:hypothetical protein
MKLTFLLDDHEKPGPAASVQFFGVMAGEWELESYMTISNLVEMTGACLCVFLYQ